jgi:hypothetical protein
MLASWRDRHAAAGPGSAEPPPGPAHRHRRLRLPGLTAAIGLLLGLLALGPGLARGFLLSYDMVFVPDPPFSAALLGMTGGPARAVPSDAVVTVAAHVLPADIVQKIILLSIFSMACAGAAALLSAGWTPARGQRPPLLACLAAGVYYAWNPFVAERLLIGQWALLLGYAALPWVLREICTGPQRIRPVRLLIAALPAAVGGFAAMTVIGLAAIPAAFLRGTGRERWRRPVTVVSVAGLVSLPWLVPSMLMPVRTDPLGVNLFAAGADTPFGRIGSLVLLSGIWNDQTVPSGYGGVPSVIWLGVVACALAGYLLVARRYRICPGVGVAGVIGLAIAAIGITSPTRAALRDLVAAWPGFAVLRDGQQFVAALGLTQAVGMGAGITWLLERAQSPSARPGPAASQPASRAARAGRIGTEPAAAALAVLAVLAPVVLLPGMAFGLAGRLRPVQYPADWLSARRIIDGDQRPGSVLLLPWAAYRRFPWNDGEAVYDPWNKLLSREVVSNDGLQVGRQTLGQESAASIKLNRIVTAPGSLTGPLRAAGVLYVVVDAGPLLRDPRAALAADARLPGAKVVLSSRDLVVFVLG